MPKFRNIRVKMANGRSRIQRAQVLASGKLKFVKNKARSAGRRTKRAASTAKRRVTRRKSSTREAPVRRNSTRRSSNSMAGGNFLKKIPLINNPTVRKVFIAAGAASIIVTVLSLISPRAAAAANSTVGRGVIGLATGDIVGAVSNVAIPLLTNGGNGGGVSGGGNQAVRGTEGFA